MAQIFSEGTNLSIDGIFESFREQAESGGRMRKDVYESLKIRYLRILRSDKSRGQLYRIFESILRI